MFRKSIKFQILAGLLAISMTLTACNTAQFVAVLEQVGPAVTAVLEIIALARNTQVDTGLSAKINSDVASLEKLYTDFTKANDTAKPVIKNEINAAFVTLNNDLGTILQLAQVSNPNTQAKLTALIALITTAVNIAEAAINPSVTARQSTLNANSLSRSFNSILVAKTGDPGLDNLTPKLRIHEHSRLVRTLSLGLAK